MADETKNPKDGEMPNDGDKNKQVPPQDDKNKPEVVSKEEFEKTKAALAKANREAEKHRLELKETREKLGKLFGGEDKDLTPEQAQARIKEAEAKNARILLKSAFISRVAKDAVDPDAAFEIASKKLGGVKVDLANESVDGDALDAAVAEFRESHSYFFAATKGNNGSPPNKPAPDGNGQPNTKNPYGEWQALLKTNRGKEAQEFFAKNKTAIYANWPKG